jgi:chemotaxis protein MotB
MADEENQELENEEIEEEIAQEPPKEEKGGGSGDCPACPAMAPAWMATFADMATLLMAFFVLILSFVEMETPSIFKEVSGSMSNSFGVQREVPSVEPPMGQNIIAQNFRTSKVDPSIVVNVSEETTEQEPTDEELKSTSLAGTAETNSDAEVLREALAQEIAKGQVEVTTQDNKVIVVTKVNNQNPSVESSEEVPLSGGILPDEVLEIYAKVADAQSRVESEVVVAQAQSGGNASNSMGTGSGSEDKDQEIEDQLQRIRANLKSQIAQGQANVERIGDQILIQLSTQNSFRSGFAELRPDFVPTLDAVATTIASENSKVTVSGHTDNIPIAFSDRFQSNWDLSAARAAAVADFFIDRDAVEETSLDVVGFADTKPVADNASPEGRAQNRRIEILIDT